MFKHLPVDMWVPDAVSELEAVDHLTTHVTPRIMAPIGETLLNYEKKIHPLLNAFLIREIAMWQCHCTF